MSSEKLLVLVNLLLKPRIQTSMIVFDPANFSLVAQLTDRATRIEK